MNYKELKKLFSDYESSFPKNHLTGYITFSSFGPDETRDFPWEGRTYSVSSDNKAFRPKMSGYSIFGSSLDGTDQGVRLEGYMAEERGGQDGWVAEDCCIIGYMLMECSDFSISVPKLFYSFDNAQTCMLSQLAEIGELNYEQLKKEFADTKELFEDGQYGVYQKSAWIAGQDEDWHWAIKAVRIYSPLRIEFDNE